MTIYYEVVPKDAFEKILWIDSDRLGYMINTVTEAALEREKQVVKNEKRQRVDNAPYGHTQTVQRAALYPENHPYHWTVIGSLDDLESAMLDDVRKDEKALETMVRGKAKELTAMQNELRDYKPGTANYAQLEGKIAKLKADTSVETELKRKEFIIRRSKASHAAYQDITGPWQ